MRLNLIYLFTVIFIGNLLIGCSAPTEAPVSADPLPVLDIISPTPPALLPVVSIAESTKPPPVVSVRQNQSPPDAPAALALPETSGLVTATPIPTATPTPVPSATVTPLPTFTPPALPGTSPNEHYWFRRPVPSDTSVWTDKTYPYGSTRGGTLRPHHGVEFFVPTGTKVMAVGAGTVVFAGSDSTEIIGPEPNFYGNVIVIQHQTAYKGQPVYTLYGHLSEVRVSVGDTVESLQTIGLSGASGVADGPHLHFEVRVGQNRYTATRNPLLWLYPFSGRGSLAGQIKFPDGTLAFEARVTASRIDAASAYNSSTTYAISSLNPDDGWQENFVIDDIRAGYYKVFVRIGDKKYQTETWIYPLQTAFVELVVEPASLEEDN